MKTTVAITLMAMLGPFAATGLAGQEASEADPVIIAHRHTVHSSVLGEDRPISVALPQGYDSTEAYPVIYVMDGPGHLVHTLGAVGMLSQNGRMPQSIIVAIANTEGNRGLNMTPPLTEPQDNGPPMGGADGFKAFMRDELKPWVEARYSTRAYDILIGHSFGGLFISHVLNTEPDLFDAYISISPSLWYDEERFVASMDDMFERFPDARGRLYMTMGNEGGDMLSGAWHLTGILEKHAPPTFRWSWRHMPDETHGSVPTRSTYDGLEWVFGDWNPQNLWDELTERGPEVLPRIEAHFAELSDEMGFQVRPPTMRVGEISYRLGEAGRVEDAVTIAEVLVSWAPDEFMSHYALANALKVSCRLDDARTHLEHAMELAQQSGDEGAASAVQSALAELDAEKESGDCTLPGSAP